MSAKQKKEWSIWLLATINLMSGILHFFFEKALLKSGSIYREFLLIENVLIGIVFLYFGYQLIKPETGATVVLLKFQLLWWLVFSILVVTFWGSASTLSMLDPWIPCTKSYILLFTGVLGILVSAGNYIRLRKNM